MYEEVGRLLQQHGNVTIDTDKYAGRTCYPILNEAWQDGDTHFTVEGAPANRRKMGTSGIEMEHGNSTQGKWE